MLLTANFDPPLGGGNASLLPPKLRQRIRVDPSSGCWVGSPPLDRDGYARYGSEGMHCAVWKCLVGPIPPGLVLDHVKARGCVWNSCCWPAHLEPVTPRVNTLRGRSSAVPRPPPPTFEASTLRSVAGGRAYGKT